MAYRAVKFVIAASFVLAIMCFQTRWRWEENSVTGTHVDALTGIGDGIFVLVGAGLADVLAFAALVRGDFRRPAGMIIALTGIATLSIILYDIIEVGQGLTTFGLSPDARTVATPYLFRYHATPLLYFAAFTSFLIALAGVTMALARPEHTSQEPVDEGMKAWA